MIKSKNYFFATVDRISSFPIIFTLKNNNIYISDNGIILSKYLKLKNKDIDLKISKAFAMSGYTIDKYTLYKSIFSLLPGEFLWVENNTFLKTYYKWMPWKINRNNFKFKKQLS